MLPSAPLRPLVIIRPAAEIATKKNRTRGRFQQALKNNAQEALARRGLTPVVRHHFGRFFAEVDDADEAGRVLSRVFGIASYSPVMATMDVVDLESIASFGRELFAEGVRGKRYAVRARRQGQHPFSSRQVEQELGFALDGIGRVDLEAPEITAHVEVLGDRAYFFCDKRPGPGGLPSAVQGRALVLLSGGFDSAVAAWRAMRRGVAVDFVLMNLAGRAYERTVLAIVRVLLEGWGAGQRAHLYVVDFEPAVDALKAKVRPQYFQVVLKRLMYRTAQQIAQEIGAEALITGESIGQVSSQTLANLAAIDAAAEMPVLRPLLCSDKTEIIAEARRIGTAALSEHVKEYCAISTHFPVTATDREKLDRQENKLDLSIVDELAKTRRMIDPFALSSKDTRQCYLFTDRIPAGATVFDCQPPHLFRSWHAPGAEHREPGELIDNLRKLDKARTYVVYCSHGGQAAYLAELMQRSGYDAYAFEGGAARLRRSLST